MALPPSAVTLPAKVPVLRKAPVTRTLPAASVVHPANPWLVPGDVAVRDTAQ